MPTRNTNGVAWGDVDNDGDADLYVSSIAQTQHFLYINDGAGHFTEEAFARGAAVGSGQRTTAGTSVSFGDYDNDGWLDMYVGEWRELGVTNATVQSRLLHNLGSANPGHFEDTTYAAGVSMDIASGPHAGETHSFTPRFVDFDRDGHQDIAVASDYGTTRMFWNNGDGSFTDGTSGMGVTFGDTDMGFAVGDINGDTRLDWFNTDVYIPPNVVDGNRLFINNGDRIFTDATPPLPPAGQQNTTVRNTSWGWGTELFDHDNDSDLDLIATNGYFWQEIGLTTDRTRFFENNGAGAFTEKAILSGITDSGQGRGLFSFDYDKDGDLDVFIVNNHQAPVLYRNNGNGNNWLDISAVGLISNRDGIGAFITVTSDLSLPDKKLVVEIDGSSSYLAQSEKLAHFGLGPNSGAVDLIRIEWPASGVVQEFTNVTPNQILTVVERVGDFNGDGHVDTADYTVWRDDLGMGVAPGTGADGTGDGLVDELDYALWRRSFGMVVPTIGSGQGSGAAAVPEPDGGLLFSFALAAGIGSIRRKKRRFRRLAEVP